MLPGKCDDPEHVSVDAGKATSFLFFFSTEAAERLALALTDKIPDEDGDVKRQEGIRNEVYLITNELTFLSEVAEDFGQTTLDGRKRA